MRTLSLLICAFLIATIGALSPSIALAQASPAGVSPTTASAPALGDAGDAALVSLKSEFDLLKMLGLGVIVVSATAGLATFGYMHKRLMKHDALVGFLVVLLITPFLFWTSSRLALSQDGAGCLSATLVSGSEARPFDDACRGARESAANMVGAKALWKMVMGESIVSGLVVPMAAGGIMLLMYFSTLATATALYFIVKPFWKKLFT